MLCKLREGIVIIKGLIHKLVKKRYYVPVAHGDYERSPRYTHKPVKQQQRKRNADNKETEIVADLEFPQIKLLFLNYRTDEVVPRARRKVGVYEKRNADGGKHHTDDKEHEP